MPPKKFLFVNQTGPPTQSPDARQSEQAEILSHVQSRRYQPARWSSYTSTLRATEDSQLGDRTNQRSPGGGSMHVFHVTASDEASQRTASPSPSSPVISTQFTSNISTDLFNSTSVQGDADTHIFLRSTVNIATRPHFLAEAFASPTIAKNRGICRHDDMLAKRLQLCTHDETLMYASLACGSCFVDWTLSRQEGDRSPEYFLDRAISSLRQRLADPNVVINDWIIMSMHSLAVTQLWNGLPSLWPLERERDTTASSSDNDCLNAADMHFRACLRLVETAGGWQHFDAYTFDSVIITDKFLATIHDRAPLVSLTWNPGQLPEEKLSELGVNRESDPSLLGLGKSLIAVCGHEKLKQMVPDIVSYINIAPLLWAQPSLTPADEHWLFRRFQALISQLQFFIHSDISLGDRCLSLAILVFLFSSICGNGPENAARLTAMRLKAMLQENWHALQSLGEETLLWLHYTGTMTHGHFDGREWFSEQILQCESPARSEAEVLDLFRDHLFVPIVTKQTVRRIRQELQRA